MLLDGIWCIFRWLPNDDSWHVWPFSNWNRAKGAWEPGIAPQYVWFYLAYLPALAAMIEGSWRILPMMLVGFCAGMGFVFAYLFGIEYSLGWEEIAAVVGFGCGFSVLFGTTWLIRHRKRLGPTKGVSNRMLLPLVLLAVAVFLAGGMIGVLTEDSMQRWLPEIAGLFSVALCSLVLLVAIRAIRSPVSQAETSIAL